MPPAAAHAGLLGIDSHSRDPGVATPPGNHTSGTVILFPRPPKKKISGMDETILLFRPFQLFPVKP
jgi:hypothetical protein